MPFICALTCVLPAIYTVACARFGARLVVHILSDNVMCAGNSMDVPEVDPPELTHLIKEMVRVKGDDRPHLKDVYQRLLDIKWKGINVAHAPPTAFNWPMRDIPEAHSEHGSDQGRYVDVISYPHALTDVIANGDSADTGHGGKFFLILQPPPDSVYSEEKIQYLHMPGGIGRDKRDDESAYMYTEMHAPDDMYLSFQLETHGDAYNVLISAGTYKKSSSARCFSYLYRTDSRTTNTCSN